MIAIDLTGAAILMTGALSATAPPILRRLLEAGATLVVTDLAPLHEAVTFFAEQQISYSSFLYLQADLRSEARVVAMVREAFAASPEIATVLGHAGGCALHAFASTPSAEFARIFELNFTAQTYLTRAVLSHWVRSETRGHLVFTSSYVARVPHVRIPAYASAKAALELFLKCMALEYAPNRIRFNALSPGNIAAGSSLLVYKNDPEYRDFVDRVTPSGERNTAEGIADAFLFLLSPLARELNGVVLAVDNGVTIPRIG